MNKPTGKSLRKRLTRQVIGGTGDDWICLCKNQPHIAGFYPCDTKGNEVEPTVKMWTTNWFVCNLCRRIIDYDTRRIVRPL